MNPETPAKSPASSPLGVNFGRGFCYQIIIIGEGEPIPVILVYWYYEWYFIYYNNQKMPTFEQDIKPMKLFRLAT